MRYKGTKDFGKRMNANEIGVFSQGNPGLACLRGARPPIFL
jgi:hypothetical protein